MVVQSWCLLIFQNSWRAQVFISVYNKMHTSNITYYSIETIDKLYIYQYKERTYKFSKYMFEKPNRKKNSNISNIGVYVFSRNYKFWVMAVLLWVCSTGPADVRDVSYRTFSLYDRKLTPKHQSTARGVNVPETSTPSKSFYCSPRHHRSVYEKWSTGVLSWVIRRVTTPLTTLEKKKK